MVTVYRRDPGITRRELMRRAGTLGVGGLLVVSGGTVVCPPQAWGLEPKALKAETVATLIQMARDIYPHDRIADRFYAVAVKNHDAKAAEDADYRAMLEEGVADLDRRAGGEGYRFVGWEEDRTAILKDIEDSAFFQSLRADLVTGLYNQKDVWPVFGYEGESYSKDGYIDRGFDDIDWL
ncbi:gluconate 2-dehydrogenase subunit 3 family protein [Nitratireductor sp. GCM10026969]|uniref:gluconate 2-dehydrogenase subunit 3 family protein n=1 Tax=Nitratireductor sp. GCM10026969 TaxID=3252645 RepID=UPI003618EA55